MVRATGGATRLNATNQGHTRPLSVLFHQLRLQRAARVHVEREHKTCKFWLEPLGLARSHGFGARELNVIRRIVKTHRAVILEAWHEHCG